MNVSSLLIAHSGCEHTLANSWHYVKKATHLSCDGIEIDVRKYNGTLCLGHNPIHWWNKPLALEVALDYVLEYSTKKINFDLKEDIALELMVFLEQKNFINRTFLSGCISDKTCQQLGKYQKNIMYNMDFSNPHILNMIKTLKKTFPNIEYLNANYRFVNQPIVDFVHKIGLKIAVWTINNPRIMKQVLDWGVDSITTNYITKYWLLIN